MKTSIVRDALSLTGLCCLLSGAGFVCVGSIHAADHELSALVGRGLQSNARVIAARHRVEQALAARDGVAGFFDPRLTAAGGYHERAAGVAGAGAHPALDADAVAARVGVEVPVRPGVYLGAGLVERYLFEPDGVHGELYQSLITGGLRVPLGRDRLFAEWRLDDRRAQCLVEAAQHELTAAEQDVRHEIEQVFVQALLAEADLAAFGAARERAAKLLADAEVLVDMNLVPRYQLSSARMEVALHEENRQAAELAREMQLILLGELTGSTGGVVLAAGPRALSEWAGDGDWARPADRTPQAACERRGAYLALSCRVLAGQIDRERLVQDMKPDVNLHLSASWQGEDPDVPWGTEALVTGSGAGREVAVVWTQPLGRRREHAAVQAAEAGVRTLRAELVRMGQRIAAELAAADAAVTSARTRLRLARTAVREAGQALDSEAERFRLGEAQSRHVLDAQEDLTDAVRRRNQAAAAFLTARGDLMHAMGYPARTNGDGMEM